MTNEALDGKLCAGNPHVWFDAGGVASGKLKRGSLCSAKRIMPFGRMACFSLGLGVVTALAFPALSETVAWYRFEECGAGEKLTAGAYYENAANPGQHRAYVHSIDWTAIGSDENYFPTGLTHASGRYSSIDPAGGSMVSNINAISFGPSSTTTYPLLQIADDAALQSKTMTVEFFVRALDLGTSLENIVTKASDSNFGWTIRTHPDGYLMMYLFKGNGNYHTQKLAPANFTLKDKKWHHIAFTIDNQKTLKTYVDYNLCTTSTLDFGLDYFARGDIYVGNHLLPGYPFVGELDDLRISNAALDPEGFLRMKIVSPLALDDTVAYFSFDSAGDAKWSVLDGGLSANIRNEAFASGQFMPSIINMAPFLTDDPAVVPQPVTYGGIYSSAQSENVSSLHLASNETSSSASAFSLSDIGRTLPMESFTSEMFFQDIRPNADVADDYIVHIRQVEPSGAHVWMLRRKSNGRFVLSYGPNWTNVETSALPYDETWHHEAVVYDKAAHTLTVFLDYVQAAQMTDVTLATQPADGNGTIYVGTYALNHNCSDSRFDELRITRRALKPEEFLTKYVQQGTTLAWYDFENDWGVRPIHPSDSPGPGVPSAFTEGGRADLARHPSAKNLVDMSGAVIRAENLSFADLTCGKVIYPVNPYIMNNEITVECFLKVPMVQGTAACPIAYGPTQYTKIWALFFGDTGNLHLRLRMADGDNNFMFVNYPDALPKGWQHIAFSLHAVGGTSTEVKLYSNYQCVAQQTLEGLVMDPVNNGIAQSFMRLGESWLTEPFTGQIDEIRISRGQLDPSEFLRFEKKGMTLTIR